MAQRNNIGQSIVAWLLHCFQSKTLRDFNGLTWNYFPFVVLLFSCRIMFAPIKCHHLNTVGLFSHFTMVFAVVVLIFYATCMHMLYAVTWQHGSLIAWHVVSITLLLQLLCNILCFLGCCYCFTVLADTCWKYKLLRLKNYYYFNFFNTGPQSRESGIFFKRARVY